MTLLLSKITLGAVAATMLLAATPSFAVVQTFATFSSPTGDRNLRYLSSGSQGSRTTDATVFTIATPTSTTLGATAVQFSFLSSALGPIAPFVTNVNALYTFSGVVAKGSGAGIPTSGPFSQTGFSSGAFSFVTTSAITLTGPSFVPTTYSAGSLLLGGSFTNGQITGVIGATSGGIAASGTVGPTISLTSDFLDFTNVMQLDLAQSLTAVLAPRGRPVGFQKNNGNNGSITNFTAVVGGQFSSDPLPIQNFLVPPSNVPEPQSWALMVIGFGMLGVASRRRKAVVAA